jgi:hypothetical protein
MTLAAQLELGLAPGVIPAVPVEYPVRRPAVEAGVLRRRRRWPPEAEVLISPGDRVAPADVLARRSSTGRAAADDVVGVLGLAPDRAAAHLLHQPGEMVAEGDVLAERRALGGLQRRTVRSPATGRLTYVSPYYGNALIEPLPVEDAVAAHLAGAVVEADERGVTVEGYGIAIAGAAGAGPAASGILQVVDAPEVVPPEAGGTVLACAFDLDERAVQQVMAAGAVAVVAAGIDAPASERLGWDDLLWPYPAAEARLAPPITVVLLAAGTGAQSPAVWGLLRRYQGRHVSVLGAEPGAVPEVLIMPDETSDSADDLPAPPAVLEDGATVRAIYGQAAGTIGAIAALDDVPYRLASEIRADVAEVALPNDLRLRVPRLHLDRLPPDDD